MPRPRKPIKGRPPIPASERRTKRLVVLFTVAEWEKLTRASDDPRLPLWARRYLLAVAAATGNEGK